MLGRRLALALLGSSSLVHAQPAEQPRPTYWVDFEAGKVVVEPEQNVLQLEEDVAIKVHRYRLTSERLVLRRGPRGIVVDGEGRVAFCPCPDPPVTIGFSEATVAPPTDLLIEDPTLRVGDVPILWLPYLWLRAPDRLGMLPPRVAWRGDEGLLVGTGVHVPLGGLDDEGQADAVDLYASGYLQGGFELEARASTETTSTRARFDHLRQSLLAIDARGSVSGRTGAALAWRMDAIRGERGRRGTLSLEEASRRWDRVELAALGAEHAAVLGVGARGLAERGGEIDAPGSAGPAAHAGLGAALGEVGALDAWLAARSLDRRDGAASSVAEQRGELSLAARPGPFGSELVLAEGALLDSRVDDASGLVWAGAGARLGLPLVRAYGTRDPLLHRVEPFVRGSGRWTSERGTLAVVEPLARHDVASASGGIRTTLGRYGARQGGSLELEGGAAGAVDTLEPVLAATALADADAFGLGGSAHWVPDERIAASGRARAGRVDALHLAVSADGRAGAEPLPARLLGADLVPVHSGWFDREGWTLGSELGVPWTRWLASALAADYDLTRDELLGIRGSLGYRHPCGCLAALAWAGHRLGRDGVDAWLTVDLLP